MTSDEAVRNLESASGLAGSAVLSAALGAVPATDAADPLQRAAVLRFLSSMAQTADVADLQVDALTSALRHASSTSGADSGERQQLLDVHRRLLDRAFETGSGDLSAALAAVAVECEALSEADRATLLAAVIRHGGLCRTVVDALERFAPGPAPAVLLAPVQRACATPTTVSATDTDTLFRAAAWALRQQPGAAWAQRVLALALNRRGEFERALDAVAPLEGDPDAAALGAWALMRTGRFDDATARLQAVAGVAPRWPDLFHAVGGCLAFEHPAPQAFHVLCAQAWQEPLRRPESLAVLGPAAVSAAGAALAQAGRVTEALTAARRAVEQEPTAERCYRFIQLLIVAGQSESVGLALDEAPQSAALTSVRLQHACSEYGVAAMGECQNDGDMPLLRARQALLTGEPHAEIAAPERGPRDLTDETLRVNLALAARSKHADRLKDWMDQPLFALLPAPEREAYRGIHAWMDGDVATAEKALRQALRESRFLPAVRALAIVKTEQKDHAAALPLWEQVVRAAPLDGRAVLHKALRLVAAGRPAEGVGTLTSQCAKNPGDQRGRYWLARIELSQALVRSAMAKPADWDTVSKPARRAALLLDKLTIPDSAWYAWACAVLQIPPASWPAVAANLIAQEPVTACLPPVEAQWLRGHLRVLDADADRAAEGLGWLAALAAGGEATDGSLGPACWRAASTVQTTGQASRLARIIESIAHDADAEAALEFLTVRFGLTPRDGQLNGLTAVARVRGLFDSGDRAALGTALDELRRGHPDDAQRLLAALVALELGDAEAFAELASGASSDRRWQVLRAVALAKQGHKDAVAAFCGVLTAPPWPAEPPPDGILAFVGARARKHVRQRVIDTLAQLPPDLVAADPNVALNFFRASAVAGDPVAATAALDRHPQLATHIRAEIDRMRHHQIATAIDEREYGRAQVLLSGPPPGGASIVDARVAERVGGMADVEALLAAVSPNPRLTADARRHQVLLPLARSTTLPAKRSMQAGRDTLRSQLADRRRHAPVREWQPQFRALAILHWEWALTATKSLPPLTEEAVECFRFANFLWRHLLTHERFWSVFTEECGIGADAAAIVRTRVETEIFDVHREQAYQCLAASDADGCRFHLGCLLNWATPPKAQFVTPDFLPTSASEGYSLAQAAALSERASSAFEAWIDQVLWRARKLRQQPVAPESLPAGVGRDFDAAIRTVREALDAVPDHARLCTFLLEQYADYAYVLVGANERGLALERLQPAITIARRLANERFRDQQLVGPDGDLIRRVFDYAWKLETDEETCISLIREYLHWNGPDAEAEGALRLVGG